MAQISGYRTAGKGGMSEIHKAQEERSNSFVYCDDGGIYHRPALHVLQALVDLRIASVNTQ
jgi:hypothetical protein